jgi:glycerol-3-phosphate dehydrogenase subunit C
MVTTYDPHHPAYTDEADVRGEMTRVFGHCQECRACVELCASFPSLFGFVDRSDDRDAGRLTPAEQDVVVDQCFHCNLCAVNCPYTPGDHEWAIDFPRLMLRAGAMRRAGGQLPLRGQITSRVRSGAAAFGRSGGAAASIANTFANTSASSRQGSVRRTLLAATTGVSPVRLLPPFAKERFSTWFRHRTRTTTDAAAAPDRRSGAVVYATCTVEYHDPQIGKDLVRVYERNGIECSISGAGCCGAPSLHVGDVKRFARIVDANVRTLAKEIRDGTLVVAEPTCSHILRHEYPVHCSAARRDDAALVAARTQDACEYLVGRGAPTARPAERPIEQPIDTNFTGDVPDRITYHHPCHLRAQDIGVPGVALLELTGAEVHLVQGCAAMSAGWGLRTANEAVAVPMARALAVRIDGIHPIDPIDRIDQAPEDGAGTATIVAGDCGSANLAIAERTGRRPSHPLSVIARAYGIPTD